MEFDELIYSHQEQATRDLVERLERIPSVKRWARDLVEMLAGDLFIERAQAWKKDIEGKQDFFRGSEKTINTIKSLITEEKN
jgi:hypothetical protein